MIDEKRFSQYNKTFSELHSQVNTGNNNFRPQKVGNNVRLLAGVDGGKYAISVVSDKVDIEVSSTTLIRLKKAQTSDEQEALIFCLMDEELLSIFISFCIDLEGIIEMDTNVSVVEIYNRYLYWQKMFKLETKPISESAVKGLISELYILKNYMIPKYGLAEAVNGWMGTEYIHKDYAYEDNMWYEAKAINVGKLTVQISSIEQLQSEEIGLLVLTELERTSNENSLGTRLIDLLDNINDQIEIEDIKMLYYNKVASLGISLDVFSDPNHPANSYRYLIKDTNFYKVDDSFPRLERRELPLAIGAVSYELILSELDKNKTEFF